MTFGQMSEIFFMLVMPWFFRRLGVKLMIRVGMLAWPRDMHWSRPATTVTSCGCYMQESFCTVSDGTNLRRPAPENLRAAAQGFIAFVTLGIGMFIGSWLSGRVVDHFTSPAAVHMWDRIWIVPAIGTTAVLLLFATLFTSEGNPA